MRTCLGVLYWNVFPCVPVCTTAGALEVFHGCLNAYITYAKKEHVNMNTNPWFDQTL